MKVAYFAIGLLIVGALDEWTQPWVNRCCDLNDWLADMTGIILGSMLVYLFLSKRQRLLEEVNTSAEGG